MPQINNWKYNNLLLTSYRRFSKKQLTGEFDQNDGNYKSCFNQTRLQCFNFNRRVSCIKAIRLNVFSYYAASTNNAIFTDSDASKYNNTTT